MDAVLPTAPFPHRPHQAHLCTTICLASIHPLLLRNVKWSEIPGLEIKNWSRNLRILTEQLLECWRNGIQMKFRWIFYSVTQHKMVSFNPTGLIFSGRSNAKWSNEMARAEETRRDMHAVESWIVRWRLVGKRMLRITYSIKNAISMKMSGSGSFFHPPIFQIVHFACCLPFIIKHSADIPAFPE